MIVGDVSAYNRELCEQFERLYPDYEVYASVSYVGFVDFSGSVPETPENRYEGAIVFSKKTGKPLSLSGVTIPETLMLGEVLIAEQKSPAGRRVQFDPSIVDRYLPPDLLEAGWRCHHFWKGDDENRPWGPYRIGLINSDRQRGTIEWDQPWLGLELLHDEVRAMNLKSSGS